MIDAGNDEAESAGAMNDCNGVTAALPLTIKAGGDQKKVGAHQKKANSAVIVGNKRSRKLNMQNDKELQQEAVIGDESFPSESLQVVPIQSEPMIRSGV